MRENHQPIGAFLLERFDLLMMKSNVFILRYDTKLVGARKAGVMRGAIVAVGAGFMW